MYVTKEQERLMLYISYMTEERKMQCNGMQRESSRRRCFSFLAFFQLVCCRRCAFRPGMSIDSFRVRSLEWCSFLGGGVSSGCVGSKVIDVEHVFNALANFTLSCHQLDQRLFLLLLFLGNVLVSNG